MSNLNFLHSGGNKVTLSAPTSDPSSNPNFKLPQSDGSAGQVLQTDGNGNLSWVTPGTATTNGITMLDQWRLTSAFTGGQNPISSNLERVDNLSSGTLIGSGMSVSSGYWTFPSTGIYKIEFDTMVYLNNSNSRYIESYIYATTNNSSYSEVSRGATSLYDSNSNTYGGTHCNFLFDVTNVSTHKVYFRQLPANSSVTTAGSTNNNFTYMTFMRIGDT